MNIDFRIFSVLIFFSCLSVSGQKKNYYTARLAGEQISTDGYLNEKAWSTVEWGGEFFQIQPYKDRPPSQKTGFKILYDDNFIYVALKAFDTSPDSIVNRMSRRDDLDGDQMGIGIDSYHDLRTAFVFSVNSAGVKLDAAVTEDGNNWDYNWDPVWYVKTAIDTSGWTAEMKIPLTQLRFGKQDEYVWGIQIGRTYYRKKEDIAWQYISPNSPGWVSFFSELHGIKGIKPQRQKDITPYTLASVERYKRDKDNPFSTGSDHRMSAGLDGKFGITNDLTLDFSINPDFGQVEADPSVVNLSTFETFYQEKRPFFIEGRNIMNFNLISGGPLSSDNLFYSRRIGRTPHISPDTNDSVFVNAPQNSTILGALKLTGKTRTGWSIGILESATRQEFAKIDTVSDFYNKTTKHRTMVEPLTNYFLCRIQKDLNGSNTRIGGMLTATNRQLNSPSFNTLHKSAYTGGFDFNHQWKNKTYYINFSNVFSYVTGSKEAILNTQTSEPRYFQRPDAPHLKVDSSQTNLFGTGGTIQIGRAGNSKWPFLCWVTWRSPSLELNDMGYLYTSDIIQQIIWVGYQNYEAFSIFRYFCMDFNQWYGSTYGNEKLYFGGNWDLYTDFKNYWHVNFGASYDTKSISTSELRGGPSLANAPSYSIFYNFSSNSRKKIIVGAGGNHTVSADNSFIFQNYFANINWRISKALKISISPSISLTSNKLMYVNNVFNPVISGDRYIRGSMNQTETSIIIRAIYNITPDFTIQYYGMPFVSVGNYSNFKYITHSKAKEFNNRFMLYNPGQIKAEGPADDITYLIDENNDGKSDYGFGNPDYNFFQCRSNLIARWEFEPGSTAYFVWSFSQERSNSTGIYSFARDMGEIFKVYPHNIFLIKVSYRFGL
jgi:hypothetical protein